MKQGLSQKEIDRLMSKKKLELIEKIARKHSPPIKEEKEDDFDYDYYENVFEKNDDKLTVRDLIFIL